MHDMATANNPSFNNLPVVIVDPSPVNGTADVTTNLR